MFTIIDKELDEINEVIDKLHDLRNYGIIYGISDQHSSCLNALSNKLNRAVNDIVDKMTSNAD